MAQIFYYHMEVVIGGSFKLGSLITDSDINQASKLFQAQLPNVGHSLMEDKFSLLK